jgi:hypothetical protein
MASLVCSWIKLVDAPYAPPGAGSAAGSAFDAAPAARAAPGLQDALKPDEFTLLQVGGGVGGGGREPGAPAMAWRRASWGRRRGSEAWQPQRPSTPALSFPLPSSLHPQELARDRFDPNPLLAVFRRGRPTWLHSLVADPRGRRLVLDLSAEHRSSIFLNYAMRRIFDMVGARRGGQGGGLTGGAPTRVALVAQGWCAAHWSPPLPLSPPPGLRRRGRSGGQQPVVVL